MLLAMIRLALLLLLGIGSALWVGLLPLTAVQAQSPPTPVEWVVATKPIPPLVFIEGEDLRGFSVDLWEEVARRLQQPYRWLKLTTVTEQLDAVRQGRADVAIAAISMTPEREEVIDFSYPYLDAGLQILTPVNQRFSVWGSIRNVLERDLLRLVAGLMLFLLVVAHGVWLFNRFSPAEHYSRNYFQGVGQAFWWAAVTLAAGGYGDEDPPRGPLRRLAVLVWMFTGIVLISNFTAAITTQNTLAGLRSEISGVSDLPGKTIVTVKGSTADSYLTENTLKHTTVQNIEAAYPLLETGQVNVIVYDSPVLQYYAGNEGKGKVQLASDIFKPELYGIALAQGSPYREAINRTLLEIKLDGSYQEIYNQWFDLKPAE